MTPSPAVARAASHADEIGPEELARLRRRMRWVLFSVAALGSTGYIAAVTVGTLVAAEFSGGAALGGLPTTLTTIGTATAASLLALIMLRAGRRPGLLIGLATGVLGGAVVFTSVLTESIPLLLLGSAFTGFANAAGNLGRYIAADMAPPAHRASAIGLVVWGTTVGAVIGPNLTAPAGTVAVALGLPELSGAYATTVIFIGLAWLLSVVALRPEPYALADPSVLRPPVESTAAPAPELSGLLTRPSVAVALVSLVAAQVVMVLIMTMTPLHLIDHGQGLATVGIVLSAHTFGMFGLSPITGRLADRFGPPRVIASGFVVLGIAATIAAIAPPTGGLILAIALFLLGYGWNLCFVSASTLVSHGLALSERTRVQGIADTLTWGTAAFASLSSGLIVAAASYTALGLLGLGLAVIPLGFLATQRERLRGSMAARSA
ncbi:MAG TPA: MFS transporter [Candidatus Limnocylindria bacterium]|nr:MFS transporter [Candidatus Limnocylindria bacterium]